jgi:hypothetical protein
MQTKILATVLALAALGAAGAATAQPYPPGVIVQVAPPPHHLAPPRARSGHAWVPGHWEWRHGRQVWAGGHWVRMRPGPPPRDPRWDRHGGPHRGGWDRDRDGVPDRYDRRPSDPYRR